ncbi:MAG: SET domain-containing protein-lysine N-methyltransferase [Candidatus Electrothrix sp. EH2]|nr:SET domain-containing protein-lysine N-methyltransferase [Candidatus Electrothrix sp. EH2]
MLLIKTYLDKSPIHGIGVFAGEFIPKGTLVWKFDPLIDIILTPEQVSNLPKTAGEFIESVGIPYPFGTDNYCLALDNAQYMNHSPEYNLQPNSEGDRALIDIPAGIELTVNYFLEDHRMDISDFQSDNK